MARTIAVKADAFEGTGSYAPIPAGTELQATIYEVEERVAGSNSKNPGSPQFVWTAKIVQDFEFSYIDDQGNQKKANAQGRKIPFNYVPLDPNVKHIWQLVNFAEAVGWESSPEKGISVPDNLNDVVGTQITITVDTRPDQKDPTKIYNSVSKIKKAKVGGVTDAPAVGVPSWDSV